MPVPMMYQTVTMLKAAELLPKRATFLRDRYFPTEAGDIFPTTKVMIDYRNGNKKIAPIVAPRKGGITVLRDGYRTSEYEPPMAAPERPLTIDDLNKRGFGENLYSQFTPEQRAGQILARDLMELSEMIDGREEEMCAQAMLTNCVTLKQYVDKYGGDYLPYDVCFYEGNSDPSLYTPSGYWSNAQYDIYGDLAAMTKTLIQRGLPVEDLVMADDVAQYVINNDSIQKMLDNRRINIGEITPIELPNGASRLGVINVAGKNINLISYGENYENENGQNAQFIPAGNVILTAPGAGHMLYGAVTQLEQGDGEYHTYAASRVPKHTADDKNDVRMLRVAAKPLPVPKNLAPWIHAKVTA